MKATGTVTAGNASGVNDGSCALLLASGMRRKTWAHTTCQGDRDSDGRCGAADHGLRARSATRKVLGKTGLSLRDMDVIELNEAFASQALAVMRELGLPDDAQNVNPNGGAIAIGHPLGASGARLIITAISQLRKTGGRYALCTMCIGVGQGIATVLERC